MRLAEDRQTASASIRLGSWFSLEARSDFSPAGLVAAGVLVSGIVLASSVLTRAALRVRERDRDRDETSGG